MLKRFLLPIAAVSLLWASPAFAHAILKSSAPERGATVSAPAELTVTFTSDVRLVAIKLVNGGQDIPLEIDRAAPAAESHAVPLPELAPGIYEVHWTGIAADGHPMTNRFSFTVADAEI